MPTFDVVSKVAMNEVDNAVQQASKELGTRFDFRDTNTTLEQTAEGILLKTSSATRAEAAFLVLQEKLAKRRVPLKSLDVGKVEGAAGGNVRQLIKIVDGISTEKAKEIVKHIKNTKLKVQASIQGDELRVTGKKRDDLQEAIAAMKAHDFGIELQFVNFRD
jgi:uncharacterized protein YajQ (UPF0234 family)